MHLDAVAHVLPDIERATLFHKDCFEARTKMKRFFAYLFERAWKRDLFNSAELEACHSDVLHAVRYVDALEMLTALERHTFNPLQS